MDFLQKRLKEQAIVEAILFAFGEPVELKNIANVLEKDLDYTKKTVEDLAKKYEDTKSGIKLIQINDCFQLCTNPEYFHYIKKMYKLPEKKGLSQALLETLAIIAFKQPITKMQIADIRGVNSDHALNSLIKHLLVEEKGRLNAAGKPILFGTSEAFLKHFELNKIEDFYKILENDDPENKINT